MRHLLSALLLLAPLAARAQAPTTATEVAPIPAAGGFFGLSVPDLEASAAIRDNAGNLIFFIGGYAPR